jgi:hypothetical protein
MKKTERKGTKKQVSIYGGAVPRWRMRAGGVCVRACVRYLFFGLLFLLRGHTRIAGFPVCVFFPTHDFLFTAVFERLGCARVSISERYEQGYGGPKRPLVELVGIQTTLEPQTLQVGAHGTFAVEAEGVEV